MIKLVPLLAAASLAFAAPAWAVHAKTRSAATSVQRVVLPTAVAPERYDIRIAPDADRLTFRGQARIAVQVKRPTDRIVLNAADLTFQRAALSGVAAAPRVVLDAGQQTAAFVFPQQLAPGRYVLSLDYTGKIYTQASGLFALDSTAAGRKVRALFTQFENSDARRFAPLWDEPGIKAVFSLSVEAPAGQMAVSNMPVLKSEPLPGGGQAITFTDTPKMSSYLLFLALGDFERIHRQVGGVDIGVVARRGEAEKGRFALDAAADLLGFYNDYFGVPYPLPKLDMIAGPGESQFFGAMENWGAIFAFDRDVLVGPTATVAEKQRVYIVTAHEMAHQWFGDLVTMAWWDDLWLNEGFASWMENKAADRFHPEWKMSLQALQSRERAMRLDSGAGSHPVVTPIPDVFAASDAFDAITYQKGQAVVGMLERYVGEDAFRAGIRSYMTRYAYGNTTTDQLWKELERVSPRPVTQVAHDFTLQSGVPLIRAEPKDGKIALSQSRFVAGPGQAGGTWLTPVHVAAPNGGEAWTGLVSRARGETAPVAPGAAPVVVNAGQGSYFRTRYARELRGPLLRDYLTLASADQIGLLYDARALGEAGLAPMSDFLDFAKQAGGVQEPVVLSVLAGELATLGRAYPAGGGQAFRAFGRARLGPVLTRVGWDPRPAESDNTPGLRDDLIRTLGDMDDAAVRAEARRRFEASLKAPGSLTGALLQSVQAVVARQADPAAWEQLHGLARKATDTKERSRLYRLLGAAKDPALADRALALALSGEPPPTTAPAIMASVAGLYPDKAFDFAIAHRAQVEALLEPTSRTIFFTNLARGSRDPAMAKKLEAFAKTIPASSAGEVRKAADEIRHRQAFAKRLSEVDRWLAANPG
ncbi:MAG TPA: M1 family metallopeptidase [Phenylobacterium sp.]|uniref:M1 family metallopeptidase n=1 Tax=Phenylobacterium sp. TaxID=1871053 RepID=UPI002B4743C9|nr:M1 family metallopeptidase [Phenylobacterium sp.]HKR90339.1 M1 family metallopeptidase [Phenylobacterium sp.]